MAQPVFIFRGIPIATGRQTAERYILRLLLPLALIELEFSHSQSDLGVYISDARSIASDGGTAFFLPCC